MLVCFCTGLLLLDILLLLKRIDAAHFIHVVASSLQTQDRKSIRLLLQEIIDATREFANVSNSIVEAQALKQSPSQALGDEGQCVFYCPQHAHTCRKFQSL